MSAEPMTVARSMALGILPVSADDVRRCIARSIVRDGRAIMPSDTGPAIATMAARVMLDAERVEFAGLALGGFTAYRRAHVHTGFEAGAL